jgi:hypothetical protein
MRPALNSGSVTVKKTVVIAGLVFAALFPVMNRARAENGECDYEAMMGRSQGEDAVRSFAKQNGWVVSLIKVDDNCYVIKAKDKDGRDISVDLEPDSLAIVGFDYLDKDGKPIPYVDPDSKPQKK